MAGRGSPALRGWTASPVSPSGYSGGSPVLRGWTLDAVAGDVLEDGSLVCAGMDPGTALRDSRGGRLPCMRGDGPDEGAGLASPGAAPPRCGDGPFARKRPIQPPGIPRVRWCSTARIAAHV